MIFSWSCVVFRCCPIYRGSFMVDIHSAGSTRSHSLSGRSRSTISLPHPSSNKRNLFGHFFQVLSKFFVSPFFLCNSHWFWPEKVAWDLIPSATLFCGYFSFPTSILAYIQLVWTVSGLVLLVVTLFGGWSHLFVDYWVIFSPSSRLDLASFHLVVCFSSWFSSLPSFCIFMTATFLFFRCPVFTIFCSSLIV